MSTRASSAVGRLLVATAAGAVALAGLQAGAPVAARLAGNLAADTGQVLHVVRPATSWNMAQSSNWSGYNENTLAKGVTAITPYTSISGQWVVPTARQYTPNQAEYSATWIGVGGGFLSFPAAGQTVTPPVGDETLIQAGTEQDVAANGTTSYAAWYELIPEPQTSVSLAVHPGDTVSVQISQSLPELWAIVIRDLTTHQSVTVSTPYPSTMDTAEWIEETPLIVGGGAGIASMPNLSRVSFSDATLNGAPAGLQVADELQLYNGTTVLATPSAPNKAGTAFNDCTYATQCPAPGTEIRPTAKSNAKPAPRPKPSSKAKPKKPVRHIRVVTFSYRGGCSLNLGDSSLVEFTGDDPSACQAAGTAFTISPVSGEKYVSVTVTDKSGRPLHGEIWLSGGAASATDAPFCGSISDYAGLQPGSNYPLTLDAVSTDPSCASAATEGTVTITYSNLP